MNKFKIKILFFLLCLSLVVTQQYNGRKLKTKPPKTTIAQSATTVKPEILDRQERSGTDKISRNRKGKHNGNFDDIVIEHRFKGFEPEDIADCHLENNDTLIISVNNTNSQFCGYSNEYENVTTVVFEPKSSEQKSSLELINFLDLFQNLDRRLTVQIRNITKVELQNFNCDGIQELQISGVEELTITADKGLSCFHDTSKEYFITNNIKYSYITITKENFEHSRVQKSESNCKGEGNKSNSNGDVIKYLIVIIIMLAIVCVVLLVWMLCCKTAEVELGKKLRKSMKIKKVKVMGEDAKIIADKAKEISERKNSLKNKNDANNVDSKTTEEKPDTKKALALEKTDNGKKDASELTPIVEESEKTIGVEVHAEDKKNESVELTIVEPKEEQCATQNDSTIINVSEVEPNIAPIQKDDEIVKTEGKTTEDQESNHSKESSDVEARDSSDSKEEKRKSRIPVRADTKESKL